MRDFFKRIKNVRNETKNFKRRFGYFISVSWVIITIIILVLIFVKRVSVSVFPFEYTMAISSFVSLIIFWIIIFVLSRLGIGLRAMIQMLYKEITTDRSENKIKRKILVDKLVGARNISLGFATITTAIIGFLIAVIVGGQNVEMKTSIMVIIFITTFLLVLATILLIHVVDMCDTAQNPTLSISMIKRIRRYAMDYYAYGLICLLAGLFLGLSVIHPYLTVLTSVTYMLIVLNYFFMWERDDKSS